MKPTRGQVLIAAAIAVLALGLTLIITQPGGGAGRIAAGKVARETYKSPRTVTYKSDLKTREAEQKAADVVAPVYRSELTAGSQQDSKFQATVTAINQVRGSQDPADQKTSRLGQLLPNISTDQANTLLGLDDASWQQAQSAAHDALTRLQQQRIKQDDLGRADQLAAGAVAGDLPPPVRETAAVLTGKLLIPNYIVDQESTDKAKDKAKNTVVPVGYTVERDQVIAYRGQVLTDFDVERLAAVGLTRPAFDWQKTLAVFLLCLIFASLLLLIGPRFAKGPVHRRRLYALVTVFALGVTLLGVTVVPSQPILAYVTPVAAAALLVSIFYGFTYALIAGISFVAFFALAAGGSFELFFIHLAATVAALAVSRRVTNISGFLRVGGVSGVFVFVGMTAFSLLAANFDPANLPKFLLAASLEAALLATFAFAGTAFLSRPLGIVTFLQLLELENPRHPLLRKLATDAPGTYSHSLRIAGWVEALAEQVDADPLLARVQALYHDVGKSNLGEYFIENQRGSDPHKGLTPKESADVLRSHISEGLALAQQSGLPAEVAAAIPEHHGTTLMAFFWDAAKKTYKAPRQADFRYIGPKPQSKETAILMLADAVEAASRTIEEPDEKKIRQLITRLMDDRVRDGQLDQAPLQLRELTILREAFTNQLVTDLHKRIKYPGGASGKR